MDDAEKIKRLTAQRDELWELSTKDHATIDELTACLRWTLDQMRREKATERRLGGQPLERYMRCVDALEVQDLLCDEADVPVAEFEGGE